MNILTDLLNDFCVYWPTAAVDTFGVYSSGSPVELACKWKSSKGETVDKDGKKHTTTATVYLSTEVALGGWLWRGRLVDAPSVPPNTQVIRNVDRTDDVDNEETLWVASV